jgi:hypothetical protein
MMIRIHQRPPAIFHGVPKRSKGRDCKSFCVSTAPVRIRPPCPFFCVCSSARIEHRSSTSLVKSSNLFRRTFYIINTGATMHKTAIAIPAVKPRNNVVRSLVQKLCSGAGRHQSAHHKRTKTTEEKDLAQRVREVGEW